MSFTRDIKATRERFTGYAGWLSELLREHRISGKDWCANLRKANNDPVFVARRKLIWKQVLEREGGKLGFGAVLAIVGIALGGVGIAAGGGAIGLPLVLLLAPAGIWMGNEVDDEGLTKRFFDGIWSRFGRADGRLQEVGPGPWSRHPERALLEPPKKDPPSGRC